MVKIGHVSQDLLSRLHNEKTAKNVGLEKQKSKAKFSIAVSAKYNVTFKTIEEKLRFIGKLLLSKFQFVPLVPQCCFQWANSCILNL